MELGGAETSLIGLLEALDPNRVDVDLFIHSHRGPLMRYIPRWVNVLPEITPYSVIESPITEALKRGQFGVAVGRTIAKLKSRKYHRLLSEHEAELDASGFQYVADCVEPFLPKINPSVEYDLCISYLSPHNYALRKVRAKKRLAWIHTDYSTIHVDKSKELPVWNGFDHIASISPKVTETFLSAFPELSTKIIEIENILPAEMIKSKAIGTNVDEEIPFNNGHNILSIGRFSHAKNFDNVPYIAHKIFAAGISDLKWYIIGYGDEIPIRHSIEKTGMHDHVILLGRKDNPYPYIKACDVYVQPSRYEGKSITVREAQLLGKPVIITDYPTAHSQLSDGIDGVIVPLDNDECAKGIASFLTDNNRRNHIINNLETADIAGLTEIEKIYGLL